MSIHEIIEIKVQEFIEKNEEKIINIIAERVIQKLGKDISHCNSVKEISTAMKNFKGGDVIMKKM